MLKIRSKVCFGNHLVYVLPKITTLHLRKTSGNFFTIQNNGCLGTILFDKTFSIKEERREKISIEKFLGLSKQQFHIAMLLTLTMASSQRPPPPAPKSLYPQTWASPSIP
jgi:hypothetical protein